MVSYPSYSLSRRHLVGTLAALPAALGGCDVAQSKLRPDLAGRVSGPVAVPGDALYELRRSDIWSALVPARYPSAIVTAQSVEDVQAAVRYAASNDLSVAIRGGGHNWSAASLRDDSLLIDLGQLRELRIDAKRQRAFVRPGIAGGTLLQAARKAGLAFPIAHCPSVPMSGFLLNGGFGFNSNAWGSAAAHVLSMDIVVASGELVRAAPDENADLYWAARGSGPGFFGAVVGFELNLMPDPKAIVSTNYIFPLSAAAEAAAWAESLRGVVGVNVEFTYLASAFGGDPATPGMCIVGGIAFTNSMAEARKALAFLQDCPIEGKALMIEREVETPWETLLEAVAGLFPPKLHYLGNTIWSDAPITQYYPGFAKMLERPASPYNFSNCVFYPVGKPDAPVLPDAAVSMQRQTLCLFYSIWEDPADTAANEDWFKAAGDIFLPHASGNYIGEADLNIYPNEAEASYGPEAWKKLKKLRSDWDPNSRFPDFLGQST
ncbi:MAG: FAD-binding oxidoreductase [Pseudomonadota bacterium]